MSYTQDLSALANEVSKASMSKEALYLKMRALAERHRAPGQSVQQSFAKIFVTDPVGQTVMQRYSGLGAGQPGDVSGLAGATASRTTADSSRWPAGGDDDGPTLDDLVQAAMKALGLKRPQAMTKVLSTPQGTRAYRAERTARLRAASGY